MHKSKKIIQVAVLLFSMTLAGCFVAYRAGVLDGNKDGAAAAAANLSDPMLPSTKSMPLPPEQQQPAAPDDAPRSDDALIGSTKSGKIFQPDSPRTQKPAANTPDNTFMGSSKNDGIFEPNGNLQNTSNDSPATNKQNKPVDDRFMSTSKSGEIFRPAAPDTPQTKVVAPPDPDAWMGSSKAAPVFAPAPVIVKPTTVKPKPAQQNGAHK